MSILGKRIKEERTRLSLTQEALGKKCRITKYTISLYENGKSTPNDDIKKIMSKLFDVSLDYLMGNSNVRNAYSVTVKKPQLTKYDEKDIEKVIKQTKDHLENVEGLMFSGNPATPEAIESILPAMEMEMGMALAKQKNKEKYTPKK